jgi:hypothetical protein
MKDILEVYENIKELLDENGCAICAEYDIDSDEYKAILLQSVGTSFKSVSLE